MSLWSRITGAVRNKSSDAVGSELLDAFNEWGLSGSGVAVNSWTAMQHVAVMACVSILAEDVAKIPLAVYRRLANGGQEKAKDHPLNRLLRDPNNWQTALEFKEMMQAALVLRGNAYAVCVRDGFGRPLYLVPVHPDRVTLYEAPGGEWFYLVTRNGLHEMAVLREQPILVPQEDVLHLRWLSQWNSLLGSSRISLIRESVGVSMGLEEHQARFIGQGARVGGALQTDQKLAPEVRTQLAADWQRMKAGPRNSGAAAVLEQGLKWQQLGLSMVDSQFIESRGFQLRDIARAFGVPPYKLGIEGDSTGPSMVQQGQEYLNGPISGYCERWKAKGEKFFGLDGDDYYLFWDYSHFLRADIQTRYTAYRQAVGGPWMSVNEARRGESLPDAENGDTVLQAGNMAPLGSMPAPGAAGQPGSDSTGTTGQGGDGDAEKLPDDAAPGV
jgi:HK97 family phage portal protein